MPRKRKSKGTMAGYFREIFENHPEWLHQRSNREVMESYRRDHGLAADADVGKSVKNTLSNLKSNLRSKERKERKQAAKSAAPAMARSNGRIKSMSIGSRLEKLEEMIDSCLSLARSFADDGLYDVVRHLHTARNKVVWKIGEPA